jgi:ATP-binding cassette subfamily B (MDR/TAP) protein 1
MPNITAFAKAKAGAYNIFTMIEQKPTINVDSADAKELSSVQGHIEFRNVQFSYPSRPDVIIFRDFSLDIPASKTVAIVGGSGSGKSTVVSLIERFYDPSGGEVLLDGTNIRSLNLKWLRGQIGLVNQEPALFATSIKENILYGKPDATEKEIEEACKAANAHTFVSQLPQGYNTQVGERGVQMSGGQKQRIAIARAILKNPTILLLDEATSALDASSEQIVQEALDRVMVGRTTVVVAHRLSTIQNADTIAVVQEGVIVEMGNHAALLEKNGAYTSLVRLQGMAQTKEGAGKATLSRGNSQKEQVQRYTPDLPSFHHSANAPIL